MCHAQEHNTVTLVRLESAAPRSRVKHSTTRRYFLGCSVVTLYFASVQLSNVSNSLDPDQYQHSVGPDLGPVCFLRLSADNKSRRQ